MNIRLLIIFITFSLLILFPFLTKPNIINGNDLNGNIVPLLHFKESITKHFQFPQWNPYMNQGIPTTADPLYGIFNPLIGIPILLFEYQLSIKVIYFLAVFISCITMLFLLRTFKVSYLISTITAMTYAGGSYVTSRIVSGHLEKVVSFAFLPLFLALLVKTVQKRNILWSGLTAITLSLILFSGDIYNTLFCLYSVFALSIYFFVKDRKIFWKVFLIIIFFGLFSSIKILPMIELQNYISKIKEPFTGGLNLVSIFYSLFFPFDLLSGKLFSNVYSTGFPWWESLAFIGPLSVLGLYFIIKTFLQEKPDEMTIVIILTILFLLLSVPGSKLNPLHYLVSLVGILQYFHVPSRVLALFGAVILLSLALCLNEWRKKYLAITLLSINLLAVFFFLSGSLG